MPFDLKYLSSWRRSLSRRGQARVGPWPWSKTWEKAIERREVKGKDHPQVFLNNVPLEELEEKIHRYRSRPAFFRVLQAVFTSIDQQDALYRYYKERTVFRTAVLEAKLNQDQMQEVMGFKKTNRKPGSNKPMLNHTDNPESLALIPFVPKKSFLSTVKAFFMETAQEKENRLQAEALVFRQDVDRIILNWIHDEVEATAQQVKQIYRKGREYGQVNQEVAAFWRKFEQDTQFELIQRLADYERRFYFGVEKNNTEELRAHLYNKNLSLFKVKIATDKENLKKFEKSLEEDSEVSLFSWTKKRFDKEIKTIKTAIRKIKDYATLEKKEQDSAEKRQLDFEKVLARHADRFYPVEATGEQQSRAAYKDRVRTGLLGGHSAYCIEQIMHFGVSGKHKHLQAFSVREKETQLALPDGLWFIKTDPEKDAQKSLREYLKVNQDPYGISPEPPVQADWLHGYLYRVERYFDQILREGEKKLKMGQDCLRGEAREKVHLELTRRLDSLYREATLILHPDRPAHAQAEPWLKSELTVIFNKLNELRANNVYIWDYLVADESRFDQICRLPTKEDCEEAQEIRLQAKADRMNSYMPIFKQKLMYRLEAEIALLDAHKAANTQRLIEINKEIQRKEEYKNQEIDAIHLKTKEKIISIEEKAEADKKQAQQEIDAILKDAAEFKKQSQQEIEAIRQDAEERILSAEERISRAEQKAEERANALQAQMAALTAMMQGITQVDFDDSMRTQIMNQITPFLNQANQNIDSASLIPIAHIA